VALDDETQVIGGLADRGEVEAPICGRSASAVAAFSGCRTISIRSWLSDSSIS